MKNKKYIVEVRCGRKGDKYINDCGEVNVLNYDDDHRMCSPIVVGEYYESEAQLNPAVMRHPLLWEPSDGDFYYFVGAVGRIEQTEFRSDPSDALFKKYGNLWQTRELAEKYGALGVVTPYLREIAAYNLNNDGTYWWPDWSKDGEGKYCGAFLLEKGLFDWCVSYGSQLTNDLFYFKNQYFVPSKSALAAFKKYLGVE